MKDLIPSFISKDYLIDFCAISSVPFCRDWNVGLLEVSLKEIMKVIRS